jgi:hypothetical protein
MGALVDFEPGSYLLIEREECSAPIEGRDDLAKRFERF